MRSIFIVAGCFMELFVPIKTAISEPIGLCAKTAPVSGNFFALSWILIECWTKIPSECKIQLDCHHFLIRYCSESCELVHRGAHWKECRGKPGWVWRCLDKNPATDKLTATVDIPRGTKVCYFDYQWRLDDRAWHQSYKLLNGKTSILDSAKYFKAFKLDYSPISHLIEYR